MQQQPKQPGNPTAQPVLPNQPNKLPDRLPIPKLTRPSAPGKLVFVGLYTRREQVTEKQYKRVPVLGHAIYWRRARRKVKEKIETLDFSLTLDLFEWITKRVNKRETVYVYFYDVVTDFLALDGFRLMPVCDFTLQSIYHKLTTTIMKFACDKRRVAVIDIQNYYPVKFDILSRSFGAEIGADLPDDATGEQVREWCVRKARLLFEIVKGLIKETVETGRGSMRMTASSTAHSIFRTSYMKHKIITNHNPEVVAFEQSSYVGGYTGLSKLLQPGEPELYKVDVNSMYPSVMMEQKYPTQLIEFAEGVTTKHLERFLHGYMVIAEVLLSARRPVYPFRQGEQTHYPVGEFTTTLSTNSLRQALESDEIKGVSRMAVYMGYNIFGEFVTDIYNRRVLATQENNPAHALMQKAINNTLYGKFGQLSTDTVRVGDAPMDEFLVMDAFAPVTNDKWVEIHAGGSILFIRKGRETRYTSFAIASHITDYARCKLFSMMEQAGKENVFYADTDSLIVNSDGLKRLYHLIDHSALGALKIEGQAPFYIGFAKKDYMFGGVRKLKGFSEGGERLDDNVFSMYQRAGFGSHVAKQGQAGAYWRVVNKSYNPFLLGEHIGRDGEIGAVVLPDEADLLKVRRHTVPRVQELARRMFTDGQRAAVGEWLG